MAGVSHTTGDLLYWDYFQRRRGESKRPLRILRPFETPCPAASVAGGDRECLEKEGLLLGWIPYRKAGRYVEITLFFTGRKKSAEPFGTETKSGPAEREDSLDLILEMVEEMVRRNRGAMKYRGDQKVSISLEFLVARRRAFYHLMIT